MPHDIWGWIIAVGGPSVIATAIATLVSSRLLEGYKAKLGQETERLKGELAMETETHKLKLKKMEVLFGKQLDAVKDFIALKQKIYPQYSHPDKDWDEACDEVARELSSIEKMCDAFTRDYGAVLTLDVREKVAEIHSLASIHKFAVGGPAYGSFPDALKAAGDILHGLSALEELMIKKIQN